MLTLSATAIGLSIACGAFFSGADYFRKAVPAECPALLVLFYFIAGQLPVLIGWLLITGEYTLTSAYWLPGGIDVAAGLAGNLLFIVAVRRSPLSLMIPVLALVPVLTAAFGALLLGEAIAPRQAAGILLVVAGLALVFTPPGQGIAPLDSFSHMRREPGLVPMLGAAACWSVTPALDKLALAAASVPVHGLIQVGALAAISGAWLAWRGGAGALRAGPGAAAPLAGAAATAGIAYVLQLAAYAVALVTVVELVKRVTSMVFALAIGRWRFAEPVTGAKIAGLTVIGAGLPLVLFR